MMDCFLSLGSNMGNRYDNLQHAIREISINIAVKVAEVAFDKNIARVSRPENLMNTIEEMMFSSKYPLYV